MPKLKHYGHGLYIFFCPGCQCDHHLRTEKDGDRPIWSWNGSIDAPVASPSLLVNKDTPEARCHSFIGGHDGTQPGKIQFLGDCFHALAGETVEIPDYNA